MQRTSGTDGLSGVACSTTASWWMSGSFLSGCWGAGGNCGRDEVELWLEEELDPVDAAADVVEVLEEGEVELDEGERRRLKVMKMLSLSGGYWRWARIRSVILFLYFASITANELDPQEVDLYFYEDKWYEVEDQWCQHHQGQHW